MSRIQSWVGSAALAAIALSAVGVLSNGGLTTRADARESYTCMTDDGYGRLRPCSAGYMASNPAWRAGDSCFTDDGYGRYRPCSAGYKAKQQQKK